MSQNNTFSLCASNFPGVMPLSSFAAPPTNDVTSQPLTDVDDGAGAALHFLQVSNQAHDDCKRVVNSHFASVRRNLMTMIAENEQSHDAICLGPPTKRVRRDDKERAIRQRHGRLTEIAKLLRDYKSLSKQVTLQFALLEKERHDVHTTEV